MKLEMDCDMNDVEKNALLARGYKELEDERKKTIENMSRDIYRMSEALYNINDLSEEGKIIREDLFGLLEFESNSLHQVDSLMIERRKKEKHCRDLFDSSNILQ